jgi:ribosome biogenesis protein BMS1
MEPEDKKLYTLMQRVNTLKSEKQKLERERVVKERAKLQKRHEAEAAPFAAKKKQDQKRHFRSQGLKDEDRAKKRQRGGYVAASS